MSERTRDRGRARDPLQVNLKRLVWLVLLAVILPTMVLTGVGIAVLVTHRGSLDLILGILAVSFAVSVIAGSVLLMILAGRGARIARIQSTFLSRMSHELRTPLAGIHLHAQLLQGADLPPGARASVEAIERESERLTSLVERILRWREIRSRGHLYRKERTTPAEVLEGLRTNLPTTAGTRIKVRGTLPPLRADREALVEALSNLVLNAQKYGSSDEAVEVVARRAGRAVAFAVSDRGPGLPDAPRDRLFEPFFRRPSREKTDPGGSGLGLSIARQIVRAHGGRIEARDRPGGGSRFTIVLPAMVERP